MSILLYEEHDFPFWDTTLETINDYVIKVKNFFIENFHFYVYDEITTYNNRTVCYFSQNQNELPCFCFIHGVDDSVTSNTDKKGFFIAPVLYNSATEELIPVTVSYNIDRVDRNGGAIYKGLSNILLNCAHSQYIPTIVYIVLEDGRKIICFKNKNRSTGYDEPNLIAMNGCLYYTPIKNDNEDFWAWIILARSPASSYIPGINRTVSYNGNNNFHEYPYQYINPRYFSTAGGFIPDLEKRKDFLLKLPYFYLGDYEYIENIFFFSKVLNFDSSGSVGTIITIKDKDYIILQHSNNINNLPVSTSGNWSQDNLLINTISLITPVNIEEESSTYSSNISNTNTNNVNSTNNSHDHSNLGTTPSISGS